MSYLNSFSLEEGTEEAGPPCVRITPRPPLWLLPKVLLHPVETSREATLISCYEVSSRGSCI